MEEQFVPYEFALKLKELGFDEPCIIEMSLGNFDIPKDEYYIRSINYYDHIYKLDMIKFIRNSEIDGCTRPLWQQTFDWFRNKHGLRCELLTLYRSKNYRGFSIENILPADIALVQNMNASYEEARLACLEKLIEYVENEKKNIN